MEGNEGAEAGVLFEVREGDGVDIFVGCARWVDAEVVAERMGVVSK